VAVDLPERELLAQMVAMAMRFRSMASNVCDATGLPRRVVKPRALALLRTSCFVKRPLAKSWKARRTSGARSESGRSGDAVNRAVVGW